MNEFFIEEEQEIAMKKVEKKSDRKPVKKIVPAEYIPVKLSTKGKLNMPEIVHVKDYTGEDALKLSMSNEDNILSILIDVLQGMIYEGIDPMYLHEKELEEIMLNVYTNFWSSNINNYPFPINDDEWNKMDFERKQRIEKGEESLTIDINIAGLETINVHKDFKEPIIIKDSDGTEVHFRLPRIIDHFTTQEFLEKKYIDEDLKFKELEGILKYNEKVPDEHQKKYSQETFSEYKKHIENKAGDFFRIKQSLLIEKYGSKKLDTLKEKIEYYKKITFKMWNFYNTILEKYCNFGVSHDVKMISPINDKETVRRCLFQFMDFIPSGNIQQPEQFTVQFGDE